MFGLYDIRLPIGIKAQHIIKPRLDVVYPAIESVSNPAAQLRINNALYYLTNGIITDQGYYRNPGTECTGYFEVKNNQREILSVSLINDAYSGGVHGLRMIKSLTADVRSGKIYKLRGLFKSDADYVRILTEKIKAQIADRGIYLIGQFAAISPDADFYVADKALVIYFQLYEITPYAFGFPYFPISIYDLKDITDDKGPLKALTY